MVTCSCGREFKREQDCKIHKHYCKGIRYCANPNCNIQLIKPWQNKYCSIKCSALCTTPGRKHSNETRKKISIAHGGNGEIYKYNCLYCNNEIISKKYCNNKCQNNYIYEKNVSKWLDNPSSYTKYRKFMKRWLMEKYNNKCQKCNWSILNIFTGNIPLEIHHIDGNHENNLPSNFELLCPNCHSLTDTYAKKRIIKD